MLDRVVEDGRIFNAWDDEPWIIKGAAVRVSLICFAADNNAEPELDGKAVERITANLSASSVDLTIAGQLTDNSGVCFEGCKKYGPFDVPGRSAREWLQLPQNPNGEPNAQVLRPWLNAMDVARRSADRWVVDFYGLAADAAALFEKPFSHAERNVRPVREKDRNEITRTRWWLFERSRPDLRNALARIKRYIVTPVVAKHRLFVWVPSRVLPSNLLDAIAREDDTTFGLLHSRIHEAWALGLGTSLEDRPRYTPSTTFETFPFPEGLTPNIPAADYASDPRAVVIAEAARELDRLRNAWLNPPDLVRIEPEVVPGYPDRLLPKDAAAEKILKTRTLTNLYNERPTWLANAHRDLDAAVAAAYGWPADISDEDALARLLALNLERAAQGR
ncbi:MAG TPA: type IIL restriction-modification enzyme MmeI [Stellaceae bacterium]|nr:type IIL restriction-modification enzyme MmeI [Stellaceae bacterium]